MSKHLAVPESGLVMPQRPQLVRWGSVFSGTVIGLANVRVAGRALAGLIVRQPRVGRLQQLVVVDRRDRDLLHFHGRPHCRRQLGRPWPRRRQRKRAYDMGSWS